jgi:putative hydrolase of the HAD superfamily
MSLRSSASPPVRALILDLGNVLIFHDNAQLFHEMAAATGRTPDEVQYLIFAAEPHIDTVDGPPEIVYDRLAPAVGFPGTFDEFAAIWNGIFTPHEAMVPLIAVLRGRVRLVVLSNTNPLHLSHIRSILPLLDQFDAVLASYELGAMKPDPSVYRLALEAAGVEAREAAFFDDHPRHVAGAKAAGIRGFLFTDAAGFVRDLETLGLWPPAYWAGPRRSGWTHGKNKGRAPPPRVDPRLEQRPGPAARSEGDGGGPTASRDGGRRLLSKPTPRYDDSIWDFWPLRGP